MRWMQADSSAVTMAKVISVTSASLVNTVVEVALKSSSLVLVGSGLLKDPGVISGSDPRSSAKKISITMMLCHSLRRNSLM